MYWSREISGAARTRRLGREAALPASIAASSEKLCRALHGGVHRVEQRLDLLRELARTDVSHPRARHILGQPARHEPVVRLLRFLDPTESTLLIDVGGHTGEWAARFLETFHRCDIVAFEPLDRACDVYRKRFARENNVAVHNVALSDRAGRADLHVSEVTAHSSLHRYDPRIEPVTPDVMSAATVTLQTLDDFELPEREYENVILKVDVQGHEVNVLAGAAKTLERVDVALIECSFVSEYAELRPSFADICSIAVKAQLHPVIFLDFGRMLGPYAFERDVIFAKESLCERVFGW